MSSRPPSRSGAADPNADLAEVVARVGASKTSFYSAMRLLPEERRNAMFAIYAFCREVDDIADEPATQETKQQGLDLWRSEIEAIYAGRPPSLPLARALVGPVHQFGLLKQDFIAVIDGMRMDAERDIKAPSLEELDLYCARVASAVGRLSVRIFGDWRPRADEVADHLGRALQLTNILRDLDEDAARGRLYLPREILLRHGIDSFEPRTVLNHPAIVRVCTDIAAEARRRYDLAHAAMRDCKRRAMRPAAIMSGVYARLLDRLVARGWTPPRRPVRVPTLVKIWIALKHGFL